MQVPSRTLLDPRTHALMHDFYAPSARGFVCFRFSTPSALVRAWIQRWDSEHRSASSSVSGYKFLYFKGQRLSELRAGIRKRAKMRRRFTLSDDDEEEEDNDNDDASYSPQSESEDTESDEADAPASKKKASPRKRPAQTTTVESASESDSDASSGVFNT